MNPKKESTPRREIRWKYEESHKEERRAKNANFQTMIPRKDYEEICAFLKERNMTKVDFIKTAYKLMKEK